MMINYPNLIFLFFHILNYSTFFFNETDKYKAFMRLFYFFFNML